VDGLEVFPQCVDQNFLAQCMDPFLPRGSVFVITLLEARDKIYLFFGLDLFV